MFCGQCEQLYDTSFDLLAPPCRKAEHFKQESEELIMKFLIAVNNGDIDFCRELLDAKGYVQTYI